MLSFYTEFPVEEISGSEFCRCVSLWLDGSPYSKFSEDKVWDFLTSDQASFKIENEEISHINFETSDRRSLGFRHQANKEGVDWISTICFDSNSIDSWVSVRVERHSSDATPFLPDAKKPHVIKTLMDKLKGGIDGELRVIDKPHLLNQNDAAMVIRLINGDSEHQLPIVYISYPFSGLQPIDVNQLARILGGMAHVLVEPSREFSRLIQAETFSDNPYGGFVGVYYSSREFTKFSIENYIDNKDFRNAVFFDVRNSLLHRRPLARCNWATIQSDVSRRERQDRLKGGSEEVQKYAAEFDKEIAIKEQQLQEAENEIAQIKSKLLDANRRNRTGGDFSISSGGEQQLYDGEFIDIISQAFEDARSRVAEGSRRDHVLLAFINSNHISGNGRQYSDRIKTCLRGYTSMDATIRSELQSIGFSIGDDGKHYKITFRGDSRYTYILPKSGSDHRGGLNAASDICRDIF